jgi:hypothetical protein
MEIINKNSIYNNKAKPQLRVLGVLGSKAGFAKSQNFAALAR